MLSSLIPVGAPIIGSLLKKKGVKDDNQLFMQTAADNANRARARFDTNRGDAIEDRDFRRDETSDLRDEMDNYIAMVLGATGGFQNSDGSSVEFDPSTGTWVTKDTVGDDTEDAAASDALTSENTTRATQDQALRRRALSRGEEDAVSVGGDLARYESDLRSGGPSSSVIAALVAKSGLAGVNSQFDKARNAGATQMIRTGGDSSKMYANLAREQADAQGKIMADAELAGLTGAEQIASSKASRLSPIINSLATRRLAMPNVDTQLGDQYGDRMLKRSEGRADRLADFAKTGIAARTGAATSLIPHRNIQTPALNTSYMGSELDQIKFPPNATPNNALSGTIGSSVVSGVGDLLKNIKF